MNICNPGLSTIVYGNAITPTYKKKKRRLPGRKEMLKKYSQAMSLHWILCAGCRTRRWW